MIKNIKPIKFDPDRAVIHIKFASSRSDTGRAVEVDRILPKKSSYIDNNVFPKVRNYKTSYQHATIEQDMQSNIQSNLGFDYDQSLVDKKYLPRVDMRQSVLWQPTKERVGEATLPNNNNHRIKYIICILRKPSDNPPLINSYSESGVYQDAAEGYQDEGRSFEPSKEEVEIVERAIQKVKDHNNVFRKAQLTTHLRNSKMKARNIQCVLDYLVHVKGALKMLELQKLETGGRPPSPSYQIL